MEQIMFPLVVAQQNFINFGVSEKEFIKNVRSPNKSDIKNPNWKPLEYGYI